MVCGGVARFPSAERRVRLVLVCPEDDDVKVLVIASCSAQPEVQRPPAGDPPRGWEATHELQQAGRTELLPQVRIVEPDHLSILVRSAMPDPQQLAPLGE